MQVSEAFSYQFEDNQWPTKLGIGALISLVPVINFAVAGYELDIVRNVAAGVREPLPQWDDFGRKWREGLLLTLAGFLYSIPVLIAMGLAIVVLIASGALSQNGAPGSGRSLTSANIVVFACFIAFLLLYSLFLSLLRPVITVLFSKEGTLASCFRLDQILRIIHRQPGPFFTTWIVIILAGLAIGLVVAFINVVIGWIPCIGWAIGALMAFGTPMYLLTVECYVFGQFRLAAFKGGNQVKGN